MVRRVVWKFSASKRVDYPCEYRNFRLISISQWANGQSLRAILVNEIAFEAARTGTTQP